MFLNDYIWRICERKSKDLLEHLLALRGVASCDKEAFLNPKFPDHLFDPFLMPDMAQAIKRLKMAQKNSERIGVFADFDADGILGAVLLKEGLLEAGFDPSVFISERQQGYGLSREGILELKNKGVRLLITVDLGITGRELVDFAKSLGLEVIVTDHHEVQEELYPQGASAVLNPKIAPYPFGGLSGAAVAWKLLYAMAVAGFKISESFLKWSLDLVALSLVVDIAPLVSESRVLYRYGEIVLKKTRRQALLTLYKKAGLLAENIDPYAIGYLLGPRINAANRVASSRLAFRLLSSSDPEEIEVLAERLEELNRTRQRLFEEAFALAEEFFDLNKKIVVAFGEWPEGINGLVAQKLAEKYARPAVVFSFLKDGRLKGSARSPAKVNLLELFADAKKHLLTFGGHKNAVGLSLLPAKKESLLQSLLAASEKLEVRKELVIETWLAPEEINLDLLSLLEKLAPFGNGNPKPLFAARLPVRNLRRVGNADKHLQIDFGSFSGIIFSEEQRFAWLKMGSKADFAFEVIKDTFLGRIQPRLIIKDVRKPSGK
jgi:single-stranded-DNA-specific exonuclease